jgi:hypothetical protein
VGWRRNEVQQYLEPGRNTGEGGRDCVCRRLVVQLDGESQETSRSHFPSVRTAVQWILSWNATFVTFTVLPAGSCGYVRI